MSWSAKAIADIELLAPTSPKPYRLHLFVGDDIECDELPKTQEFDYANVRAISVTTTAGPYPLGTLSRS